MRRAIWSFFRKLWSRLIDRLTGRKPDIEEDARSTSSEGSDLADLDSENVNNLTLGPELVHGKTDSAESSEDKFEGFSFEEELDVEERGIDTPRLTVPVAIQKKRVSNFHTCKSDAFLPQPYQPILLAPPPYKGATQDQQPKYQLSHSDIKRIKKQIEHHIDV